MLNDHVARRIDLVAPNDPGGLVVRRVEAVRVNRRRARLKPDSRRTLRPRDRFTQQARWNDA